MLTSLRRLLPETIFKLISSLPELVHEHMQELRIREGRPFELVLQDQYGFVSPNGNLSHDSCDGYVVSREECRQLLDLITQHSLYSYEEEIRQGYITVTGGHRVGLSGRTVLNRGDVRHIQYVTGFNFRFAKEMIGAARGILPLIWDNRFNHVHHTLIISPPQKGKTTLLRDLIRLISYGGEREATHRFGDLPGLPSWGGLKVAVVDERSELAACYQGVPTFDLGPRTDVMDACPKAEGMMMMIRSMSPDVLVADEIGRPEDGLAIQEAVHAGVRVIVTAHGYGLSDMARRPMMKELFSEKLFSRYIVLDPNRAAGTIKGIYGSDGKQVELSALTKVRGLYD